MEQSNQIVHIVDDDEGVLEAMSMLFDTFGVAHKCFNNGAKFLKYFDLDKRGCILLDMRMPGMTGIELQAELKTKRCTMPIIFITAYGDIPLAVRALRAGAFDFLTKPFPEEDLLERIKSALDFEAGTYEELQDLNEALHKLDDLTPRERVVFEKVVNGDSNKMIGIDLGISERTVEVHRAHMMQKLGARSLAHLVRIGIRAEQQKALDPTISKPH